MTAADLIAEGLRLAKPCVYLRTTNELNTPVAAIWGGRGIIPAPRGPYKHWLSIDCSTFPDNLGNFSGVMSIYTNEDDCDSGLCLIEQSLRFSDIKINRRKGSVLYARPAQSMPPIDGVFKFGSSAIQQWLAANNWLLEDGQTPAEYSSNFPGKAIVEEYEQVWRDQMPLFVGSAHAVLGGWSMPWPDGDWDEMLIQTLMVWTFEDAEPWVEVWRDTNMNYTVIQRIT